MNARFDSVLGMVEDIAVVEERYQMARFLGIPPDAVPTESVDYAFPLGVWVPAACESDASVRRLLRFWVFCTHNM